MFMGLHSEARHPKPRGQFPFLFPFCTIFWTEILIFLPKKAPPTPKPPQRSEGALQTPC